MKDIFGKMTAIGLAGAIAVVCFTACGKTNETTQTTENTTVEETAAHKVGGWTIPADTKITDEEFAIFNKGIEGLVGVEYEPVAYLGSQVVAGSNYRLLCKSTATVPGVETEYALVTIYADLNGNAEISDISEITFGKYDDDNADNETSTGELNTQITNSWAGCEVDADAAKADIAEIVTGNH